MNLKEKLIGIEKDILTVQANLNQLLGAKAILEMLIKEQEESKEVEDANNRGD